MPVRTIAVLGGLVQDLVTITDRIPDEGETVVANQFNMSAGGKGANFAVAAYRLSRSNPNSRVDEKFEQGDGLDDELSVRMIGLKEVVKNSGVNVGGVREIAGESTALGIFLVEARTGKNRIMLHQGAANALEPAWFMTAESLGAGVIPDLLIAQLEIRRDTIEQAIETAHKHNIEVLLNPAPACYIDAELYPMISHLIVNETEAKMLSDRAEDVTGAEMEWSRIAEYFHELGVDNVVITLGEDGAYYSRRDKASTQQIKGYVEAEKGLEVKDTYGAGDSFVGGYAANYMEQKLNGQWDILEAVLFGCKAASRVIEHIGCLEPIAWRDEVDIRFRSSHNSSPSGSLSDT